jgi:hypothetical protein
MKVDWDVNDDGEMELPVLTGFSSVALLPNALVAVQLRGVPGDVLQGRRLQIGMSAEVARELAAGLLKAVEQYPRVREVELTALMINIGERQCRDVAGNLVGYSSPTCPEGQAARLRLQCQLARWFVFSSIWEMQHVSRFALR